LHIGSSGIKSLQ